MGRYRKKPVEIEAVRWDGANFEEVRDLARRAQHNTKLIRTSQEVIVVQTMEGDMRANIGDWIILGVQNELYPCHPAVFTETYERADDAVG